MRATRLSASTRFIFAVLRLSADIADGFGKVVLDILQKQYPTMLKEMKEDPQYSENAAASIGHKLVAIARKQLQYNEQDAYDAIQDFLTYLYSSKFDFKAPTKRGNPGAATWKQALGNIYSNMRTKAMSHSFKKFKAGKFSDEEKYADALYRKLQSERGNPRYTWSDEDDDDLKALENTLTQRKVDISKIAPTKLRRKNIRDKTIDEAFGKRGEEGGAPEGGAGRIPQSTDTTSGLPLDEKAAKKSFLESIEGIVDDLRRELFSLEHRTFEKTKEFPTGLPAQGLLFQYIFDEDGSGTFMPDIKANMGQASDFRDWLEQRSLGTGPVAKEAKAILDRYGKRWSGFVGDTRVKLMKTIQQFTEEFLPEDEYEQLWNEFFSDVTPREVEKYKERQDLEAIKYQQSRDLRSMIRMEEMDKLNMLSTKEKSNLAKLRQKLVKEVNDEKAEAMEKADSKYKKDYAKYQDAYQKYIGKREQVQHLPLEKQPKLDRPQRPVKPTQGDIDRLVPSLDERMKVVRAQDGDRIKKEIEDMFKSDLEKAEARSIAEQAISEVDERRKTAPGESQVDKVQQRYDDIMNSVKKFGGSKFLMHMKNMFPDTVASLGTPTEDEQYAGWTADEVKKLYEMLYHEPMPSGGSVASCVARRFLEALI